jgi:hypothetical protein
MMARLPEAKALQALLGYADGTMSLLPMFASGIRESRTADDPATFFTPSCSPAILGRYVSVPYPP